MQSSLLNLDQKNAILRKLKRRVRGEGLADFLEQLRLAWVLHDHAIEGVVLTKRELMRGIHNELGRDVCHDAVLYGVHRLYTAIATIREDATEDRPLDLDEVKRMHILVSDESKDTAGRYRKKDKLGGVYNHDAPPARSISYYLRKLVDEIEEDIPRLHPVRAAATVHYRFMHVFPFDELSGRAGRLLMNYWLLREDYPSAVIPAGRRADYHSALHEQSPSALVDLIVEVLDETIDHACDAAREALARQRRSYAA